MNKYIALVVGIIFGFAASWSTLQACSSYVLPKQLGIVNKMCDKELVEVKRDFPASGNFEYFCR